MSSCSNDLPIVNFDCCSGPTIEKPVRTITEICIDADNHKTDRGYLQRLWNEEVTPVRHRYAIVDLQFMNEHIMAYVEKIDGDRSFKKLIEDEE